MRTQNLKSLKCVFCWNKSKRGKHFFSSLTNLCFFGVLHLSPNPTKLGAVAQLPSNAADPWGTRICQDCLQVSVIEFQDPNPLLPTSMMTSAIWNQNGVAFLGLSQSLMLEKVTRACSTVFFAQNEQKHFRDSSTCYNWKKNTCHFHPTSCLPSLSGPSGNIWIRMIPQLLRQGCVSFPNRKVIRAVERKFKHVQRKSHCMLRASWIRFIYWKEESSHRSAHASKSTQHFPKMAFV